MKTGVFGGSFNPPHFGHLNSIQTCLRKLGLDRIILVPCSRNPLKMELEGPKDTQRLEMTRLAIQDLGPNYSVDDCEIRRGGYSYTIDTVKDLSQRYPEDEFYLIMGADNFVSFNEWKNWQDILSRVNLIVTTRPGFEIPTDRDQAPEFLKNYIGEFDFNLMELTTGKTIQFLRLEDVQVSATELRKWLRIGKPVGKYIPLSVEKYIKEQGLYRISDTKIGDFEAFTKFCGRVLFDKKGINVKGFDLRGISYPAEFTLIASGTSTRHTMALAENVVRAVKEEYNTNPLSIEGMEEGRWVVVDYGTLIVHIFYDFVRNEYSLENLWKDGRDMGLVDDGRSR
ncbi:MAG: nicotinate (nicotinamide) nucleotide adenylyltransferase [Bdellovibrionaceae bacterium]|nr:nicotinate (nicotinamide) nucleotide adenylyltransferase [Pseudobdellovibrionaceae bacterium]